MRVTCAPPTVRALTEGRQGCGEVGLVGRLLGIGVTRQDYVQRSAKGRGCLLSYSQAEPGRELTHPSPRLLAAPCRMFNGAFRACPSLCRGISFLTDEVENFL